MSMIGLIRTYGPSRLGLFVLSLMCYRLTEHNKLNNTGSTALTVYLYMYIHVVKSIFSVYTCPWYKRGVVVYAVLFGMTLSGVESGARCGITEGHAH